MTRLGELIANHISALREGAESQELLVRAAQDVRNWCIPGMNWTDEIGQMLLRNLDDAIEMATGIGIDPRVKAELAADKKNNAIKIYRSVYGVSLKEAKDAVERYMELAA